MFARHDDGKYAITALRQTIYLPQVTSLSTATTGAVSSPNHPSSSGFDWFKSRVSHDIDVDMGRHLKPCQEPYFLPAHICILSRLAIFVGPAMHFASIGMSLLRKGEPIRQPSIFPDPPCGTANAFCRLAVA